MGFWKDMSKCNVVMGQSIDGSVNETRHGFDANANDDIPYCDSKGISKQCLGVWADRRFLQSAWQHQLV